MIRLAQLTAFALIIAAPSIHYGTTRADARHAESLQRLLPVCEAALAAHESETRAVRDTMSRIPIFSEAQP